MKLSPIEQETVNRLLKEWGYDPSIDIEEDVSGMRSYHFEVHPTGICDIIYLCYKHNRCNVTDMGDL